MSDRPAPLRHEYGTPRYQVAPGIESPTYFAPETLASYPELPSEVGFYVLSPDGSSWVKTDGLTYRLWANTLFVREVVSGWDVDSLVQAAKEARS